MTEEELYNQYIERLKDTVHPAEIEWDSIESMLDIHSAVDQLPKLEAPDQWGDIEDVLEKKKNRGLSYTVIWKIAAILLVGIGLINLLSNDASLPTQVQYMSQVEVETISYALEIDKTSDQIALAFINENKFLIAPEEYDSFINELSKVKEAINRVENNLDEFGNDMAIQKILNEVYSDKTNMIKSMLNKVR